MKLRRLRSKLFPQFDSKAATMDLVGDAHEVQKKEKEGPQKRAQRLTTLMIKAAAASST